MKKKGMKCPSCGKIATGTKLRFQGYDVSGWKCSCGEVLFDPDEAQKILLLNKIMKKSYEVKIGKIRSNLIIRVPTELADALSLRKGSMVRLKADKEGRFFVEF